MKSKFRSGRYWFNLFIATILTILLVLIVPFSYISYKQAQAFLHPARFIPTADALEADNIPIQEVELTTEDGVKLSAWYTPPAEGNGAVILVAHGYGANRPESYYALFAKRGYGVLAWDFRAHGASGGDISTFGYDEQLDVKAALDYALVQPGVRHVGAWGGSMGAATVILAAAKYPQIEAVVSDSGYPSLEEALKINLPIKFMRPFVLFFWQGLSGTNLNQIRPVDEIGKISPRPVFIIDGWEGGAVIMDSPYRLYDAANQPKQIWVEQDVPHMGMYSYYPDEYTLRVISFFDEYLLK